MHHNQPKDLVKAVEIVDGGNAGGLTHTKGRKTHNIRPGRHNHIDKQEEQQSKCSNKNACFTYRVYIPHRWEQISKSSIMLGRSMHSQQ